MRKAMRFPVEMGSISERWTLGYLVDVILTRKPQNNEARGFAKTILSNLRVLAVDQTYRQEKDTRTVVGKTATLELSPGQAGQGIAPDFGMGIGKGVDPGR